MGFEDRPDYRYLKRIFKDLFDRQGFIDDGLYDWDIMKKAQEQGGGAAGAVGAALPGGPVAGSGADDTVPFQEEGLRGVSAPSGTGAPLGTGRSTKEDQSKTEEDGEAKEAVSQRKSIISSIR